MDSNFEPETAKVLNSISSDKRLTTFIGLSHGRTRSEISDEFEMTSAALQPYINDFKDNGLLRVDGKDYVVTELGEKLLQHIDELDEAVEFSLLAEKVDSMLDAGVNYSQVYDSLTDQGYDEDLVVEAVCTATDEDINKDDLQFH